MVLENCHLFRQHFNNNKHLSAVVSCQLLQVTWRNTQLEPIYHLMITVHLLQFLCTNTASLLTFKPVTFRYCLKLVPSVHKQPHVFGHSVLSSLCKAAQLKNASISASTDLSRLHPLSLIATVDPLSKRQTTTLGYNLTSFKQRSTNIWHFGKKEADLFSITDVRVFYLFSLLLEFLWDIYVSVLCKKIGWERERRRV